MYDNLRRLPTIKPRRHLPMLFLTLITASRGLTLPRPRTPTPSDPLAIGARVVRERGENVGIAALLLELREQERQCWRRRKLWQAQRDLRPLVQRRQLEPGWHGCDVAFGWFVVCTSVELKPLKVLVGAENLRTGCILCAYVSVRAGVTNLTS